MYIGTNQTGKDFTDTLDINNIDYEVQDMEVLNSINTNMGRKITYTKDGEQRFAYSVWHRIMIDDVICITAVFSHEPALSDIVAALNRT
ncbi:MAG: hypothetical protein AAGI23_09310 [Bacteroidota bacterium]